MRTCAVSEMMFTEVCAHCLRTSIKTIDGENAAVGYCAGVNAVQVRSFCRGTRPSQLSLLRDACTFLDLQFFPRFTNSKSTFVKSSILARQRGESRTVRSVSRTDSRDNRLLDCRGIGRRPTRELTCRGGSSARTHLLAPFFGRFPRIRLNWDGHVRGGMEKTAVIREWQQTRTLPASVNGNFHVKNNIIGEVND